MQTPPKCKLLNIYSFKVHWVNHTLHLPPCFLACGMWHENYATCRQEVFHSLLWCVWPSQSLCRVAPDSPTKPIATTLTPTVLWSSSLPGPRFTPYSPAHITIWGKCWLQLQLCTPRRTSRWQLEPPRLQRGSALEQSSHAPAATNTALSSAAAQRRFTFLSDTETAVRLPICQRKFCGSVSKYHFENEFHRL